VKITKQTVDRGLTIAAAAAAPVLAILIRHHVLTAADATDIGAGVTAVVVSYHGGAAVQRNRTAPTVPDLVP
jgi:hypothetical protein